MTTTRDFTPEPLPNCRLVKIVSRFIHSSEDKNPALAMLDKIIPPVEEDIEMYLSVPEGVELPELNLTHSNADHNWAILRQVPAGTTIYDDPWVSIEDFLFAPVYPDINE